MEVEKLRVIVLPGYGQERGKNIEKNLNILRGTDTDYLVDISVPRFNNGDSKVLINDSIRRADLFFIQDPTNDTVTYSMKGRPNRTSPPDHREDLVHALSAARSDPDGKHVIWSYLEARQDKRNGREGYDAAEYLKRQESLGAKTIIGFDVHEPKLGNAIPDTSFDNIMPTHILAQLYWSMFQEISQGGADSISVIVPDSGAKKRTNAFAKTLGLRVSGAFNKDRDFATVTDGKNEILTHDYLGGDIRGQNTVIHDDLLCSGGTFFRSAKKLKDMGARRVDHVVSHLSASKGYDYLDDAYRDGIFDSIVTTNLCNIPEEVINKKYPWLHVADTTPLIAAVIDALHDGKGLSPIMGGDYNSYYKGKGEPVRLEY